MTKDPAFLFYPNDYIGGTMGWSFEEKGAYIELLMMQFNRGHMTEHMARHMVGQLWDNIKVKFKKDEHGLYYNIRLELEKKKRSDYTASRRNNSEGKNQFSKRGHMGGHMEDENENINENTNNINKNKNKKFKPPTLEELTDYCKERNNTLVPEDIFDYYKTNGWVQGKSCKPIKDWKAAIRTCEKGDSNAEQSRYKLFKE